MVKHNENRHLRSGISPRKRRSVDEPSMPLCRVEVRPRRSGRQPQAHHDRPPPQVVMCEWQLRRFLSVEDSLWDQFFTTSPPDSDACANALGQGDQTFTRLQHRINSTRRAFQSALQEIERLEARDQDAVVVSPGSVSPATQTPETQLQILGSLRKNDSSDPAAGITPPTPALEYSSFSESVFDINASRSG